MRSFSTSGRARLALESAVGLRQPSCSPLVFFGFLFIGTFRHSLIQLRVRFSSLAFSASNFTSRFGVTRGALPLSLPLIFTLSDLGGVFSSFSFPKNPFKTFSLEVGGGPPPPPLPPPPRVRPLVFTSFHVAPSSFGSFSDIVRRPAFQIN